MKTGVKVGILPGWESECLNSRWYFLSCFGIKVVRLGSKDCLGHSVFDGHHFGGRFRGGTVSLSQFPKLSSISPLSLISQDASGTEGLSGAAGRSE